MEILHQYKAVLWTGPRVYSKHFGNKRFLLQGAQSLYFYCDELEANNVNNCNRQNTSQIIYYISADNAERYIEVV